MAGAKSAKNRVSNCWNCPKFALKEERSVSVENGFQGEPPSLSRYHVPTALIKEMEIAEVPLVFPEVFLGKIF